ncbi:MAG TPA: hypothetical protein VEW93_11170 [Acidimicrobiales bacterium]|nr:hypothetical protein [Acidimicrobiales bacterium]
MAPEVEDRIWAEVQRRIDMGPAGRPGLRPTPDRRPLVASLAVVACVLLVALLVVQRHPAGEDELATATTAEPGARVTLAELGAVARDQPGSRLSEGEVLYVWVDLLRSPEQSPDDVPEQRQVQQIAGDGQGRVDVLATSDPPGTPSPDPEVYDTPRDLLVGGLTPDEVSALPEDPAALLDAMRQQVAPRPSGLTLVRYVLEVLTTPLPPGPTRAALFDILDSLGVEVLGSAPGRAGSPSGVVIVASAPDGGQLEAVVDPATATVRSITRKGAGASIADPALTVYQEVAIRPAQ